MNSHLAPEASDNFVEVLDNCSATVTGLPGERLAGGLEALVGREYLLVYRAELVVGGAGCGFRSR